MLNDQLAEQAARLLARCKDAGLKLATAESCTGGLIAAYMTAAPGASRVFERGFVTYANEAKIDLLDVDAALIFTHGAVSEQVARAMAEGALARAPVQLSVSVTGIAGPGGGSVEKPVGLVHIAAGRAHPEGQPVIVHRKCLFGNLGRDAIREKSVQTAFELVGSLI